MNNLQKYALKCIKAGYSVIAVDRETKAPRQAWTEFQNRIATETEIDSMFAAEDIAIALICGIVSGYIEVIDIDNHLGDAEQKFEELKQLIDDNAPGLRSKLVIASTQSGGYHIFYRADNLQGNQKLAQRMVNGNPKDIDTFIETRGEGGYVLISPTPGYNFIQGKLSAIHKIDQTERNLLIDASKSMNEYLRSEKYHNGNGQSDTDSPGNDFNLRGNDVAVRLLESAGWIIVNNFNNGKIHLKRPGKDSRGWSATYNFYPNKLFVFSSNAHPFEPDHAYTNYQIYTLLECDGDVKDATKKLAKLGYGKPLKKARAKRVTVSADGEMHEEPGEPAPDETRSSRQKSAVEQIEEYLRENYECRYNVIKNTVEVRHLSEDEFQRLTDLEVNEIWRALKLLGVSASIQSVNSVLNSKFSAQYNPFEDYFYNLPEWDGENHIGAMAARVPVAPEDVKVWEVYFTKWLVGSVATALGLGLNHCCPVLVGEQGEYKSTYIRNLVPKKLLPYYAEAQINPADKDSKFLIAENFIINLDELETSTRDEVGHLKSLITAETIHARRAYGRYAEDLPRRASFIGSVNKAIFLADITGSRRFLSMTIIGKINTKDPANIDQIYAQALHLLRNKFVYWFDSEEIKIINENNQKYQVINVEEEVLLMYYQPYLEVHDDAELKRLHNVKSIQLVTVSRLIDELSKKTSQKLNQYKLTMFLRKYGYKNYMLRLNGLVGRYYAVKEVDTFQDDSEFS